MKSKIIKCGWLNDNCRLLLYCNEKGVFSLWLEICNLKKRIFVTCNHYEICSIFNTTIDDLRETADSYLSRENLGGTFHSEIDSVGE